jgi:hypothetical protein
MSVFQGSRDVHVGNMVIYHVEGNFYHHGSNASEDSEQGLNRWPRPRHLVLTMSGPDSFRL